VFAHCQYENRKGWTARPDEGTLRTMQSAMKYPAVIDALRRAPLIIIPMVQEAPAVILKKRPSPGKWSIQEHMCHLAHVHQGEHGG
jgi:hypothetical protein